MNDEMLKRLERGTSTLAERKAKLFQEIKNKRKSRKDKDGDDSEWEDVDEHEKEVYQTTGYFDVPDVDAQISAADQKMLS